MRLRSLVAVLLVSVAVSPVAQAAESQGTDRVLLLVDTSGSMAGDRLREARRAIVDITEGLDPAIPFGIGSFADEGRILIPPTTDRSAVLDAARGLRASGDTALRDALLQGLSIPDLTRIVVVSDGADTASAAATAQLLAAIESDPTPIYVIAINPSPRERRALERIATASGGSVITAPETFARSLTTITLASPRSVPSAEPTVAGPPAVAPAPAAAAPTSPSITASLLALAVLLGITGTAYAGWNTVEAIRRRRQIRRVLEYYSAPRLGTDAASASGVGALLPGEWDQRIRNELEGADVPLGTTAWLMVQSAVMLVVFTLLLVLRLPVPLALAGLAIGWLGTELFLRARIRANRRQFEDELADFLTLVASGLRSGLSLAQAVASGAQNGSDVLSRQMRRAGAEVALGIDLPDALDHVATRMDSDDLRWAVQALRIQREAGGSLSGILDTAAAAVRQRAQVQREVRALSAEGRLSAVVLIILPLGVFAFFLVTRREYVEIFWTTAIGWLMLAILVGILGIGTLWMRRIVDVEV
jgi:tight adherence protein B